MPNPGSSARESGLVGIPPIEEPIGRDRLGEGTTYAAFISYSRAVDGKLAPALQTGLQRFAKPLWRIRALRVFRDDANLTANPGLWLSIQEGLAKSKYFILLASQMAADSKWVRQETEYWLEHKSLDSVLVVLTDAEVDQANRIDWAKTRTKCLPPRLRDAFREEPRFVDIHWARREDHISSRDPRFRNCLADVAARLHDRPKNDLIGEDVRLHRRATRLVYAAVTVILALAFLASIAAVVAIRQRDTAQQRQKVAVARNLVTQADGARDTDPRIALQLGVAANRIDNSPYTEARLVNTLTTTHYAGTLTGHKESVSVLAFTPDGRILATAGTDDVAENPLRHVVRLWDVADTAHPQLTRLTGYTGAVDALAFAPDGRTLATGSEGSAYQTSTVRLWDVADPAHPRELTRFTDASVSQVALAFAPDSRTLATADNSNKGAVRLWDLADRAHPRQLSRLTGYPYGADAVAFAPDGRTLASESDDMAENPVRNVVLLWDVTDRAHPHELARFNGAGNARGVAFAPDGRTLATFCDDGAGGHGTALLWDVADRAHPRQLTRLTGAGNVQAVAFAPSGSMLATGSGDGTVLVWDVADRAHPRQLTRFTGHPRQLTRLAGTYGGDALALAFAPDSRTLATVGLSDRTVLLWDVADRAHPRQLTPLTGYGPVNAVAFAPDGTTLATSGFDRTVLLWDVADRAHPRQLTPLTGHAELVNVVAFTPDSRTMATGSSDHTVLLWDLADRAHPRQLSRLAGHTDQVDGVAFAPDSRTLATGSSDDTVLLWDLTELDDLRDHPIRYACTLTGGGLNRDGWAQYVSGLPYQDTCAP